LPSRLDELTLALFNRRGRASYRSTPTRWLFPGGNPGRHRSTDVLRTQLAQAGVAIRPARNAALMQTAAEVPAPVLADLLGLSPNAAVNWALLHPGLRGCRQPSRAAIHLQGVRATASKGGYRERNTVQYMLLIQYGNGPSPFGSATSREPRKELSTEERKTIGAEYAALSQALKPADDAKTVRVEDGQIVITDGTSVDPAQALRGYFVVEAEDIKVAADLAARIPHARLGGAIEVRPLESA
jgi:hypothetical protein